MNEHSTTRLRNIALIITLFLVSSAALTQTSTPQPPATPTPLILGPVNLVTPTARPPELDDPRPALCSAPYQAGWQPHVVVTGDTLAGLLVGHPNLSVTQLAALNCIDDPSSLPVGSVVWLPPLLSEPQPTQPADCQLLGAYTDAKPCPGQPQTVMAAQQLFQGGMMLWRQDTGKIWVIDNDSRVLVFDDNYREGEPDPTDTAPAGLFVPTRGFGKVWAQLPGDHEPLGWATSFESQITLTLQPAGRVSYTTYVQLPDTSIYAVTLLPGQDSGWWVQVKDG